MEQRAAAEESGRTLSLLGATGVGVGSIVGGGILVLAGVAFAASGPSAILAFAMNGVIAVLTALSFAEMAAAFPESGGAYVFAKKVLTVRAAFAVGWVLWFAYIVAGVLYALGFAEYLVVAIGALWAAAGGAPPDWLGTRAVLLGLGLLACGGYALVLLRKKGGGGQWENVGKIFLFVGLVAVGAWALATAPEGTLGRTMTPFFAHGPAGFLAAMGFTFITIQGFDLIAAVGGEVRSPVRNIPRAMLYSIAIGLAIYVPLLFVLATVGVPIGKTITEVSEASPGTMSADAVRQFAGPAGYAVVVAATVLATLSALSSNLLAASRVSFSMARDRTLPRALARLHPSRGTPVMAVFASALALAVILLMVPDLASAGAAASLIFLVSFALVHLTAFLARRRKIDSPFKTPLFPLVPVVGGVACAGLAVFQAVTVPSAGAIAAVWLGLGVFLYMALFAGRAQAVDAFAEALDPKIAQLRGKAPVVLAPVANPASAAGMVALANALATPVVGHAIVLTVLRPGDEQPRADGSAPTALRDAQAVVREALTVSLGAGHAPEAVVTIAEDPFAEIARLVRARRCESLLLGIGPVGAPVAPVEALLNEVECDVVLLRAPTRWSPSSIERIVVPFGGRGGHDELRARLLGSLARGQRRSVCFVRVVAETVPEAAREEMRQELLAFAAEETHGEPTAEVIASAAVVDTIAGFAKPGDVLVLGLQRNERRRVVSATALEIAEKTAAAVLMISHRA